MNTEKREHAFEPVFSETSTRLVLGTMPSPQSVKHGFYYSHPQNRFWPLMAELFNAPKPLTPEEKTQFVLQRDIALWDVLAVCDIVGASDASIRNPVPNDIPWMLRRTRITRIYATASMPSAFPPPAPPTRPFSHGRSWWRRGGSYLFRASSLLVALVVRL